MALTTEQLAELNAMGRELVRQKLMHGGPGRGADVPGFKTGHHGGYLTRGDVEDWLAEKHKSEASNQASMLSWEKIGVVVAVLVGIATILVTLWLAK